MVGTFLFNFKEDSCRWAVWLSPCGRRIDRWADARGYVLVISRDNLEKVGHAI
jgi:hypothetical protein